MFKSTVEWIVWSIVGLILLGMFILHYAGVFILPEYLITIIAFCLGMFSLLYFMAIAQIIKKK
jgi:hypothetical protein